MHWIRVGKFRVVPGGPLRRHGIGANELREQYQQRKERQEPKSPGVIQPAAILRSNYGFLSAARHQYSNLALTCLPDILRKRHYSKLPNQ